MKVYLVTMCHGDLVKGYNSYPLKAFIQKEQAENYIKENENCCGYDEWMEVEEIECQ